ncbi:3'-5' exonuclease [Candidatus Pacearchaeota archaeon]|nr:3'-5' exonuclease [Candidatus Pacearchaeota archaeon]
MKRLVIDTETTGLSPRFNKTLTIGMLLIDVERNFLKILDENHIFVKHPNYNLTKRAMAVNKIDIEEHNLHAIPPTKACVQINSFIDKNSLHKTSLIGHNFHFDKGFLNALFNQGNKLSKLHHQSEDTMYIWRNHQRVGNVPQGLRSNLQEISNFFEIDYTKAHDALADCHITAKVYQKLLGLGNTKL